VIGAKTTIQLLTWVIAASTLNHQGLNLVNHRHMNINAVRKVLMFIRCLTVQKVKVAVKLNYMAQVIFMMFQNIKSRRLLIE
jgi:hypothetical protein